MTEYLILLIVLINFFVSLRYYIKAKSEVPLLLAFFNILVLYRSIALQKGYGNWVAFDYGIAFIFNADMAEIVTGLITFGSTVFLYSYIYFYTHVSQIVVRDNNDILKAFILKNRIYIFLGLSLFSLFELVLSHNISANYGFLAVLGNSSFIMLFFLIVSYTDRKKVFLRLIYFIVFLVLAYISYSPVLRYQFLGWMIPLGYYLCRKIRPLPKLTYLAFGFVIVLILFSTAGVLRYTNSNKNVSSEELLDASIDRLKSADDINFIDGFIMMYEVYPRYLDFTYGMQHLEIFLRPIPRTIWPDKPLAGWFQNYEAKYGSQQLAIGFSPTIYGVFYTEMGVFGVFLFSLLWGLLLSYFYRSFGAFSSDMWALLIGILLSSLVPILRSGDLPGDFAVVLMSYWPMIIFVQRYKAFVKKQLQLQNG